MTQQEKSLLSQCGKDAQSHPVETDNNGHVRFIGDPLIMYLVKSGQVDLNKLAVFVDSVNTREIVLSYRKFYRDMNYKLCGYLEIFGTQLDKEEPL